MRRPRNRSLTALGALLLMALASACGGDARPADDAAPVVEVPRRIIAVAPSATEMLFELGLGDRVVGVGDYAKWPPEAASRPTIGGLFDARLEVIAGLDPDLAVLLPSEDRLRGQLEAMGVEVLTVPSESLADVEEMALEIGNRCGVEAGAEEFLARWRQQMAPRQRQQSTAVLLVVSREPGRLSDVLVAGPGTFLDELLQRLGLPNVMSDAPIAYPQVNLEEIILRHPQVIIELQGAPGAYDDLPEDWSRMLAGTNLEDACVRVIAGNHVLIPGPRLPRVLQEIEQAVAACEQKP